MGTLIVIAFTLSGVLLALLGAVATGILKDEAVAWLPRLTQKLLNIAVERLPENPRERYREEWSAHINEMPGNISKLLVSCGCLFASAKTVPPKFKLSQRIFKQVLYCVEIASITVVSVVTLDLFGYRFMPWVYSITILAFLHIIADIYLIKFIAYLRRRRSGDE